VKERRGMERGRDGEMRRTQRVREKGISIKSNSIKCTIKLALKLLYHALN
jgi:hypothetical protein